MTQKKLAKGALAAIFAATVAAGLAATAVGIPISIVALGFGIGNLGWSIHRRIKQHRQAHHPKPG